MKHWRQRLFLVGNHMYSASVGALAEGLLLNVTLDPCVLFAEEITEGLGCLGHTWENPLPTGLPCQEIDTIH